jgi:plasmid stabilization system protein ParE
MAYRVEFTPRAISDLDKLYEWAVRSAPVQGPLWYERLERAILSLERFPERCPVVEVLSTARRVIRQLLVGRKRNVYCVYFIVLHDRVVVLHVRHVRHRARRQPRRV